MDSLKRKIKLGFKLLSFEINQKVAQTFSINPTNKNRIKNLSNIHSNKRCFIIGNGPSLNYNDLQTLHEHNEYSFASNKIYLAFNYTDWRPTYYCAEDRCFAQNNWDNINSLKVRIKFFPTFWDFYNIPKFKEAIYFNSIWKRFPFTEFSNNGEPKFSFDPVKGIYAGCTVAYDMLQFAYYMGFDEIYLLGFDFEYNIPNEKPSTHGALTYSGEKSHFHENYLRVGELYSVPRLSMQKKAFNAAKKALLQKDIKIFNTSRKSKLDIFERVNFDSLYD